LQFHLNCPSRRTRYVCVMHIGCLRPQTHPADASAAWSPSPHVALEPWPHAGAVPAAAAGPAWRAVAAAHSATAALSDAPAIAAEIANPTQARVWRTKPNDPAAWGYAARSPMTGKIWRTTPSSLAATSAAGPPFQPAYRPANISR